MTKIREFFNKFGNIITPIVTLLTLLVLILTPFFKISHQNGVMQSDITHLKEGLSNLEIKIQGIETKFDKKFDDMNKKFDKKFDDMNKRFDDMNKTLVNFLISLKPNKNR